MLSAVHYRIHMSACRNYSELSTCSSNIHTYCASLMGDLVDESLSGLRRMYHCRNYLLRIVLPRVAIDTRGNIHEDLHTSSASLVDIHHVRCDPRRRFTTRWVVKQDRRRTLRMDIQKIDGVSTSTDHVCDDVSQLVSRQCESIDERFVGGAWGAASLLFLFDRNK